MRSAVLGSTALRNTRPIQVWGVIRLFFGRCGTAWVRNTSARKQGGGASRRQRNRPRLSPPPIETLMFKHTLHGRYRTRPSTFPRVFLSGCCQAVKGYLGNDAEVFPSQQDQSAGQTRPATFFNMDRRMDAVLPPNVTWWFISGRSYITCSDQVKMQKVNYGPNDQTVPLHLGVLAPSMLSPARLSWAQSKIHFRLEVTSEVLTQRGVIRP